MLLQNQKFIWNVNRVNTLGRNIDMITTPDLQIVTHPAKPIDNGIAQCMDAFIQVDLHRVPKRFRAELYEHMASGAVSLHTARLKPASKA